MILRECNKQTLQSPEHEGIQIGDELVLSIINLKVYTIDFFACVSIFIMIISFTDLRSANIAEVIITIVT